MIIYSIVSRNGGTPTDTKKKQQNQPLLPSDPDFKEKVFRRSFAKCPFRAGQYVKIRGTSRKAKVIELYSDIADVVWNKDQPHYVVVELSNGEQMVAAPHQLHRRKV